MNIPEEVLNQAKWMIQEPDHYYAPTRLSTLRNEILNLIKEYKEIKKRDEQQEQRKQRIKEWLNYIESQQTKTDA